MDPKPNKLEKKLLALIRQFPEYEEKLRRGKKVLSLLEKYAFKAATALALEAYTRLLIEKFSAAKDKILNFVLNAMTMIYKEPHDKEKTYKVNLGFNKIFNIGLEEQSMQEVEEIVKREAKKESEEINFPKAST